MEQDSKKTDNLKTVKEFNEIATKKFTDNLPTEQISKKSHGQYFTTNYSKILQNMKIPDNCNEISEPFAGNCDLLKFANCEIVDNKLNCKYKIQCYDIDPKYSFIESRDTLLNPPNYSGKFILTNPPYLARNKSTNKTIFTKYNCGDLYKCFIKNLLTNKCMGGIIIIPLNFWCSMRSADIELRKDFLNIYSIEHMNIFEESVFDDTNYTVCSFQFKCNNEKLPNEEITKIPTSIYPANKNIEIHLDKSGLIGGEIYSLPNSGKYTIIRAVNQNCKNSGLSNILIKCLDDNAKNQINASSGQFIDKTKNKTARTYMTPIFTPAISKEVELKLIDKFNTYLYQQRQKYNSLFLSNYRESSDIARKRISFELVYTILLYLLDKLNSES